MSPTEEFQSFYSQLRDENFIGNHYLFMAPDLDVLCIDTSLVSIGSKEDMGNLVVGSNRLMDVISESTRGKPVIVLAHHPLTFLNSAERSRILRLFVRNGVVAYLYGHTHFLGIELPTVMRNTDVPGSIDAICCPTHMDEEDGGKFKTVLGLVTGEFDTHSKTGEVVFHLWPAEDDDTKVETLKYSLSPKSSKSIEELNRMYDKIDKYIARYAKESPWLVSEVILLLFKECIRAINDIELEKLRALKAYLLVQTVNTPIGDTDDGRNSAIDGELEVIEGNYEHSSNYEPEVKTLRADSR